MYETDKATSELPAVKVIEVFEILFHIRMSSLVQFLTNMSLQTQSQFYITTNTTSQSQTKFITVKIPAVCFQRCFG